MRDISQLSLCGVVHHLFLAGLLASSAGLAAAQNGVVWEHRHREIMKSAASADLWVF